ncbi:MAG: ABC transporter permease [Longimicrobiales bacterium]
MRLFLSLYPRSFREEHGQEWLEACRARGESFRASGHRFPGNALFFFLLKDTFQALPGAWAHRGTAIGAPGNRSPRRRTSPLKSSISTMAALLNDLRFALRSLRKDPGFTTVAVLTLAMGIGANAAVFAVVDGVLLEPLPYPEPDRLAVLWQTDEEDGDLGVPWSVQDLGDVSAENRSFTAVAGHTWMDETLTGLGEPELVYAVGVTRGLLEVFGTPPFLGRDIRPDEALPGARRVAVVSHSFWTERLGADPSAVGRTLQLSGLPYEIVGVAPEGFTYPGRAALWIPGQWPEDTHPRDRHFLRAVGRLHPGSTLAGAQAELDGIAHRLEEAHPNSNRARGIHLQSLTGATVGEARTGLLVLLGAVGMVLLIACANVANLLLARGSTRVGEMAVRSTLGASRGALLRQLAAESLVLSALGGTAGLLVAYGGLQLFRAVSPGRLPRMDNVGMDPTVFLFAAGIALLVALAFGFLPALRLTRGSVASAIRQGGEKDLQVRRRGLARSSLLAAEVALSLVLLLGAGLLMRSFASIRGVELGFDTRGVHQFTLTLPPARYDTERTVTFYRTLEERISALPGVRAVGMNSGSPMGRSHTTIGFTIPGRDAPAPGNEPVWLVRMATPGYFATLRIPILRGRGIEASDGPDDPRVVVISETAANRFWPDQDPLGRTVLMDTAEPPWTIVGVAGDVRSLDVTTDVEPEAYFPHAQWSRNTMTVEVLQAGPVPGLVGALRETIQELDPSLPVYWMERLQDRVDDSVASDRFYLILIGAFACLALVLASVGLYGVTAYLVSRRTREIGIRVALGARGPEVLALVVGQGSAPVLAGLGVGLLAAAAGGRVLGSLLYGVEPLDPWTFFTVPVLLLFVAFLATALPARAATRISPTEAMRGE